MTTPLIAQSILPAWAVFPLAGMVMVFLAGHVLALRGASMPESRRRLRTANAWVMLALTPQVAVLFGYASRATPKLFVLTSTSVVVMLGVMVLIAVADMLNNARITRDSRKELHNDIARLQAEAIAAIEQAREDSEPDLRLVRDDDEETEQ